MARCGACMCVSKELAVLSRATGSWYGESRLFNLHPSPRPTPVSSSWILVPMLPELNPMPTLASDPELNPL
ncbi:hypothetical protein NDU88_006413 [Pleurodeles waltl]|uniref:Uncharacterized protein n=1 Tax=Pleurodeles waltl TaxID=8319 RepID=A0AAV7TX68_PLEWA|nr:hypothetical protein NDU88_006413 [Pleurodeles waltl]